ncbi:hypothetical protein DBC55_004509 [Salmonella enterica subsp. enterica serovar Enteritidis]|nr:hypothetical protein [Salmonella enterica subsp. enterica serovar Enteritidis]ECO6088394.1 hypothetical protein [Salmonella enterica]EDU1191817.1 hypothetical protein [Salmonella enterica subsp. enterica serovar Enteritidis]EEO4317479.1 hypothetical protein [Salmonella enterica subsp. enterica serovar Enteritidis]OPU04273.1 hypothetical protein BSW31_22230 [Salmonella enterica subsp. enterica serovar Enteritidis]
MLLISFLWRIFVFFVTLSKFIHYLWFLSSDGEIITTKAEICKVVYPPYLFPPKHGSHERIFIIYIQYDRNAQVSTF